MFTEIFTTEQKKVFLTLAEDILVIDDNKIDDREQKYLLQLCNELRLLPKDKLEYSIDKLNTIFTDDIERKSLIIELIFLALSNDMFHEEQKKLIGQVANILSIQETDIEKVHSEVVKMNETQSFLLNYIFGDD